MTAPSRQIDAGAIAMALTNLVNELWAQMARAVEAEARVAELTQALGQAVETIRQLEAGQHAAREEVSDDADR